MSNIHNFTKKNRENQARNAVKHEVFSQNYTLHFNVLEKIIT